MKSGQHNGNVLLGTCSWTDKTLIKCHRFYPSWANTAEAKLRYHASQFPTVEVDSSYYSLPTKRNYMLWVARAPDSFMFQISPARVFSGTS